MGLAVGIDLGTTNSALAYIDRYGKPVVVPNDISAPTTPSVVAFRDGMIYVGEEAKELAAAGDDLAVAAFKRQMGVRNFAFPGPDKAYTAAELSALVLKKLKTDAERALNDTITDAVITVPAYFKDPQRADTIEAGRLAGMNVLQVINEPTAAAISYGFNHHDLDQLLLVYDLGGGTFDVTVLEIKNGTIKIMTSDGDHELGGKDWDERIVEYFGSEFEREFSVNPLAEMTNINDIISRAEDVKIRLSAAMKAPMTIVHDGNRGKYELERAKFEDITHDLLGRTVTLTDKALEDIGLTPDRLDGVILVGGSTKMPMVGRYIRDTFKKEPLGGINPDEAVAMGAALVTLNHIEPDRSKPKAYALGGTIKAVDVTNHSLGMIAVNADRSAYINSIILPKNETIPCIQSRPYQHRLRLHDNSSLEIYLTQGEAESPADVSYLEKHVVSDIPPNDKGLAIIDIEYSYDISGRVGVKALLADSGQKLPVTVEPLPADIPQRFLVPPEDLQTVRTAGHLAVYMAFDLSGSMSGQPLREAKNAARSFLKNMDLSHSSIGIIAVADRSQVVLDASQNAKKIESAIDSLQIEMVGIGNDADPFDDIYNQLKKADGSRFGIVLADGVWYNQKQAITRAKKCHGKGIDIISVGFGSADEKFLKEISSTDEASLFTGLDKLVETFTSIAQVLTDTGGDLSLSSGKSIFKRNRSIR